MSVARWVRWSARVVGAGRGAAWLAAGAALAALLTLRVPRAALLEADFPQHAPARLAHYLADFTNHPKLYTHLSGPWRVQEEWSNVTWWRYAVTYECGARCAGRVLLQHAAPHAHAPHEPHRLLVRDERCTRLPLLAWPRHCDYSETESVISARGGGGALLREETRVRCGMLQLLRGCDPHADRRRHLRALRAALADETALMD